MKRGRRRNYEFRQDPRDASAVFPGADGSRSSGPGATGSGAGSRHAARGGGGLVEARLPHLSPGGGRGSPHVSTDPLLRKVWYRKGDAFQGPRVGSCLTLGNELSEETHVLIKQETLLGRSAWEESSGVASIFWKIYMEPQKTLKCQSNLEKKGQSWRYHAPRLQAILQSYSTVKLNPAGNQNLCHQHQA
ncbi:uncharacterized protein [Pseudorca crassidens]|uniref:uncharacterized protein isoform X3 n=1 Tax=Pseudorca crassidens TaxID=82174 RepID=UPI00352E8FC7